MAKYLLDEDSEFSRATVDEKVVRKNGEPVDLTKEEVKRLEETTGVKLVEHKND